MAARVDNIKLPELITRWMEVQKNNTRICSQNPLKLDVIDLTLLLRSIGMKLEHFDFQPEKSNNDTLSIEIKCNKSGILARMNYDLVSCSCPEKNEKEASFWEVQATGPSVFSKFRNNASSNLLPEISENCTIVSKAMLSNLLEYYQKSIKSIERGEDVLRSPLKVALPRICVTSPGMSMSMPFATPPAEGKCPTPREPNQIIVADNVDPKPPSLDVSFVDSEKDISASSNDSANSEGNENVTCEMIDPDPNTEPTVEIKMETGPDVIDDSSFANSEAMKALITSSPNDKTFELLLEAAKDQERDSNIIHCLQQARQQIDAALLVMKLNNPGHEVPRRSIVTATPQTIVRKPTAKPLVTNLLKGRMSLPGRPSESPKFSPTPAGPALLKKKLGAVSQLAKSTVPRNDTPRPTVAQVKTVSLLRKASSSSAVSTIACGNKASAATKKSLANGKPTLVPARPSNTTAKQAAVVKSSSTSALNKK